MMFSEKEYWNNRYKNNGNSGMGSYGTYSEFKSKVLNEFFIDKNIKEIFDYGCGDCNQLNGLLLNNIKYYATDISDHLIENLKVKYKNINNINFIFNGEVNVSKKFEMVMSLDVLYHIINDENYMNYIKTLKLLTQKYLVIFSSNKNNDSQVEHMKHRVFLDEIIKDNEFKLIKFVKNTNNTSADFYFFEKI